MQLHCSIALTKLDILDDFDEVKIGVSYQLKDSQSAQYLVSGCGWMHCCGDIMIAAAQSELSKVEIDYVTMLAWKSKIAGNTAYV